MQSIRSSDLLDPVHFLSLGAGVQSSTMALMAEDGEITPKPEAAIFADTGDEPQSVYRWLDWLETRLSFPVHRVRRGVLSDSACDLRTSKSSGNKYLKTPIPVFYTVSGQKAGLGRRHCTLDFKIEPIRRKMRELRNGRPTVTWIGISTDEAHRMKPSRDKWNTHIWPLIDRNISRHDCLLWMERRGLPKPPRSACVYCPYHSNAEWRRLKLQEPEAFERAVQFERRLQAQSAKATAITGVPFLHRSYMQLDKADFSEDPQQDFFGNECEGMCGV